MKIGAYVLILVCFLNSNTFSQVGNFNVNYFKWKIDKYYEFHLSSEDTLTVKKFYRGDLEKFIKERKTYFIPNAKKATTWGVLPRYLLLDSITIKSHASKIGFDNAWYFLKFLRSKEDETPLKTVLIKVVKDLAYKKYGDSRIYKMENNNLLNFIYFNATKELRRNHNHR